MQKPGYDPKAGKNFLHPGRQAAIRYADKVIGYLGEVHPEVCDNYDIKTKVYVAVLDMPAILPFATFDRKYTGIARFPAISRDISMVVPKEILVGDIEAMIAQRGGKGFLHHADAFKELFYNALHRKEIAFSVHTERKLHSFIRQFMKRQALRQINIAEFI